MDNQETSASEVVEQEAAEPASPAQTSENALTQPETSDGQSTLDTPAEERIVDLANEVPAETEMLFAEPATDSISEAEEKKKLAVLEAIVYVTDEPLSLAQIANAMGEPPDAVRKLLDKLTDEFNRPEHGLTVKEVAGGYKMSTKAEHHEAVRQFVKNLNPPLKLSLAALETLAVIAYKQPITAPEIMEIRGVQGAGVLKTLLDRKLITTAGRKQVVGKPILYKTTKEFLVQFGLKDLNELPTLKEFEDLRRMAFSEEEMPAPPEPEATSAAPEPEPEPVAEEPEEQPATNDTGEV